MEYIAGEREQEINKVLSENLIMRDKAAIDYVMADEHGRWFISRLLENCNVDSVLGLIRSDGNIVMDTNAMMLQEGARRVGLILKENVLSLPDGLKLFHTMESERKSYNEQQEEIRRSIIEKYEE